MLSAKGGLTARRTCSSVQGERNPPPAGDGFTLRQRRTCSTAYLRPDRGTGMIRLGRTSSPRRVCDGGGVSLFILFWLFWRGMAMEGPGLGRRGREAGLHSPGVWWVRVEKVSVWGLPVHRWRSVIMRAGGANPPPSLMEWNAPMATTVEFLEGPTARFPPLAGGCASPAI